MSDHRSVDVTRAVSARRLSTVPARGGRGLHEVDLDVVPGTLTALIGDPDDGARELVLCLTGDLTPASGRLLVFGVDVTAMTPDERKTWLSRHVGSVLRGADLLSYLTLGENLDLSASPRASRDVLSRLTERDWLAVLAADATDEQGWLVAMARILASDYDLTVIDASSDAVASMSESMWMPYLRAVVDAQARTVIVRMDHLDPRLLVDRVVVLDAGGVA